jgi:enoyl-CoA hydratase/carnithine racemase
MKICRSNQDVLLRSNQNGAVFLSLNRPDKLNTLSEAMLTALQHELVSRLVN